MPNTTPVSIQPQIISDQEVNTVNARELHAFLEVGRDFSTWIQGRIEEYKFKENQDFFCSPVLVSKGRGGHNRIDYCLTLDMAKELCMVEKTEIGRETRQYFIQCEKKLKEQQIPAVQFQTNLDQMMINQFIDACEGFFENYKIILQALLNPKDINISNAILSLFESNEYLIHILNTATIWFPDEFKRRRLEWKPEEGDC